ncbi:MAG: PadR family transcriptional regulator [Dehalococcoidales bacterium]|nr:PadR family transcriptional regulator [Dehalococcoidales bacterium]
MYRGHRYNEDRFFRGSRRESSFQKGNLKYVILDLIKDKPRHGYDIIRELEEQSHGFYKPSPGVIYPTLQMLEEMGYAKSSEQEGKKIYNITEEGLKFLCDRSNIADGVRTRMKHRWNFKNAGKMAMIMKEIRDLEKSIGQSIDRLDEDKMERIRQILAVTCEEIDSVIQE